jgi:hypothetical protein
MSLPNIQLRPIRALDKQLIKRASRIDVFNDLFERVRHPSMHFTGHERLDLADEFPIVFGDHYSVGNQALLHRFLTFLSLNKTLKAFPKSLLGISCVPWLPA